MRLPVEKREYPGQETSFAFLRWGGIVWACIEFFHEEVDLITAEEFRDNAEAPFLERGGDCFEISHECTYSDQIQVCPGMKIGEVVIPGNPGLDPGPGIQGSFQ